MDIRIENQSFFLKESSNNSQNKYKDKNSYFAASS